MDTLTITGPSGHPWVLPLRKTRLDLLKYTGMGDSQVLLARWLWEPQLIADIETLRGESLLGLNDLIGPEKAAENPEAFLVDLEAWEKDPRRVPFVLVVS